MLILIGVVFPYFEGLIPFRPSISFDTVMSLKIFGEFLLDIVAVPTLLILLNRYWTRKQREDLIMTTSNSLRLTVNQLKTLATEYGELVNTHVYTREDMSSFEREQRILSLVSKIQNLRQGRLANFTGNDAYGDEKLNTAINYLCSSVVPVVDRLTEITRSYPDVEEIREVLSALIIGLDLLIRKLNGDKVR
jgi:hypothetical protein